MQTKRRYGCYFFALFIVLCLLVPWIPTAVSLVQESRSQAYLNTLELDVGKATFRYGQIVGLSFSDFDGGELDDDGLAKLSGFDKLEFLDLRRCPITDGALSQLRALPTLRNLSLEGTQVGDAGMRHLVPLHDLRFLNLQLTNVSDSGLEQLRNLENLRSLALFGTQVTDEGVNELQEALPNCKIIR